jgi:hypothetical protein
VGLLLPLLHALHHSMQRCGCAQQQAGAKGDASTQNTTLQLLPLLMSALLLSPWFSLLPCRLWLPPPPPLLLLLLCSPLHYRRLWPVVFITNIWHKRQGLPLLTQGVNFLQSMQAKHESA